MERQRLHGAGQALPAEGRRGSGAYAASHTRSQRATPARVIEASAAKNRGAKRRDCHSANCWARREEPIAHDDAARRPKRTSGRLAPTERSLDWSECRKLRRAKRNDPVKGDSGNRRRPSPFCTLHFADRRGSSISRGDPQSPRRVFEPAVVIGPRMIQSSRVPATRGAVPRPSSRSPSQAGGCGGSITAGRWRSGRSGSACPSRPRACPTAQRRARFTKPSPRPPESTSRSPTRAASR